MNITVTIKGSGKPIELVESAVTGLKVMYDSPNDNLKNRSSERVFKVEIEGITSVDKDAETAAKKATLELFKWTLLPKGDVYREVSIFMEKVS